jgi:cell wall-associated NlpC family hydrolase
VRIPRIIVAVLAVAALGGTALAGATSAAPPTTKQQLQAKRTEAQSVLDQVNALGHRLDASVEAWHGAQYELARTKGQLTKDQASLKVAKRQQQIALARVRARLVALYESSDDPTTIAVLFGSSSVSNLLNRLEAVDAIASSDHRLAIETTAARARYAAVEHRTEALVRQRTADVVQLRAQREKIGSLLANQNRLLASVKGQVAQLQTQEAHEQAVLAAQARARLLAEQRAAAAAAAASAARERAAAAERAKAAEAATTTTTAVTTTTTADPVTSTATTTAAATTTTTAPPVPSVPSAGPGHPQAAQIALHYLGIPYLWGGASPSTGFDCSGLVMYVYAQLGIQLPHYAAAQFGLGASVAKSDLQPGDLVFFDSLNHVGIYIGGGEMVHAPETGDVVKITPLSQFGASYVGARRL